MSSSREKDELGLKYMKSRVSWKIDTAVKWKVQDSPLSRVDLQDWKDDIKIRARTPEIVLISIEPKAVNITNSLTSVSEQDRKKKKKAEINHRKNS